MPWSGSGSFVEVTQRLAFARSVICSDDQEPSYCTLYPGFPVPEQPYKYVGHDSLFLDITSPILPDHHQLQPLNKHRLQLKPHTSPISSQPKPDKDINHHDPHHHRRNVGAQHVRNDSSFRHFQTHKRKLARLTSSSPPSDYAATHHSPPDFLKMVEMSQASGKGLLILSCADPRVNPHEILGLDSKTNSEFCLIRFDQIS